MRCRSPESKTRNNPQKRKEKMKKTKDKTKQALLIARAKRTALGRFLCRLAGDNAGAVMMEYVVLGVMVVAAVVAIVMLFGQQIRVGFDKMLKALRGEPQAASNVENVSGEDEARGTGATLTGAEAKN